jgi:hypothetical protein
MDLKDLQNMSDEPQIDVPHAAMSLLRQMVELRDLGEGEGYILVAGFVHVGNGLVESLAGGRFTDKKIAQEKVVEIIEGAFSDKPQGHSEKDCEKCPLREHCPQYGIANGLGTSVPDLFAALFGDGDGSDEDDEELNDSDEDDEEDSDGEDDE